MYSLISATNGRTSSSAASVADMPIVYVVDDDVSIRESLELLIRSAGFEPMLFASARDFLSRWHDDGPSCMVLDVNLPGLGGLDLQRMLTSGGNRMPIIFVSGFGDVPMTVKALKGGACDFLTKPIDSVALLDAIRSAVARSKIIRREDEELTRLQLCYGALSRREREVMVRVVTGLLNKQVAYELDISEITVKAHRGQVMRKMNARTLPDLVKMAALLGLGERSGLH
ncbi:MULTISPECIES: response regulator transcription factor [Rhizobium]|uniref:Response regulator receiver protein n=1 Tax=Rhizobium favelukesii TaxID=348824 RepID=W6RPE5_9HYPH|nr:MULTISPECIES: response regulator [Rhizobium]MCS0460602.1 response regulator [Rhizobium favelukesii]UFS79135.1 response regulator [Rhizobium sp. T136]CDM62639.1 response regulator receiver protein [Rhizobium favelukesii]